MTKNRRFIHFLLALGIGLMPVLNLGVASAGYPDSMPMDCVDCDLAEVIHDDSCKSLDCSTIVSSCGFANGAGYLPVSFLVESIPIARVINPGRDHSDYRPNLSEPIYRPPIA